MRLFCSQSPERCELNPKPAGELACVILSFSRTARTSMLEGTCCFVRLRCRSRSRCAGSRSMRTGQIRSSRRLKASTNTPEAGKLSNGRLLHDIKDVPQPYIADDIRADEDGNIWTAGGWSPNHAMNGVLVFAPDGTPLSARSWCRKSPRISASTATTTTGCSSAPAHRSMQWTWAHVALSCNASN